MDLCNNFIYIVIINTIENCQKAMFLFILHTFADRHLYNRNYFIVYVCKICKD